MTEVSYRVVTRYGGHPLLGIWESATRRNMDLKQATDYLARKAKACAEWNKPSSCGTFLGIRIEAMVGEKWVGYGPDQREVLS